MQKNQSWRPEVLSVRQLQARLLDIWKHPDQAQRPSTSLQCRQWTQYLEVYIGRQRGVEFQNVCAFGWGVPEVQPGLKQYHVQARWPRLHFKWDTWQKHGVAQGARARSPPAADALLGPWSLARGTIQPQRSAASHRKGYEGQDEKARWKEKGNRVQGQDLPGAVCLLPSFSGQLLSVEEKRALRGGFNL